jgi:hypothetical protein
MSTTNTFSDAQLTTFYCMTLDKIAETIKLINDDNFMQQLALQALIAAKPEDVDSISVANNKDDNVAKEIAEIVVSSQTALMTTLTKGITGQGREITLHSNISQGESYDDKFICYVNESNAPKSFPVMREETSESRFDSELEMEK